MAQGQDQQRQGLGYQASRTGKKFWADSQDLTTLLFILQ